MLNGSLSGDVFRETAKAYLAVLHSKTGDANDALERAVDLFESARLSAGLGETFAADLEFATPRVEHTDTSVDVRVGQRDFSASV